LLTVKRRIAAFVTTFALAGLTARCGPSVQSIYEGNVRFEHCHRLDLDSHIASSHREACWREWLKVYTYGQVRDRIEHARLRIRDIEQGEEARPALKLDGTRRPEDRGFYVSSPTPTSAHSPPPPTAPASVEPDAGAAPEKAPPKPAPKPDAPGANCASACQTDLETCQRPCQNESAAKPKACASCEPDYKKCMRRCFE
jgi:hypothetical protein